MKTLIATLIVSVATATSAFAANPLAASLIADRDGNYVSTTQVSGFTGIAGEYEAGRSHNPLAASLIADRDGNYVSTKQVSGFTGIAGEYEASRSHNPLAASRDADING